jgi:hypothetical protein
MQTAAALLQEHVKETATAHHIFLVCKQPASSPQDPVTSSTLLLPAVQHRGTPGTTSQHTQVQQQLLLLQMANTQHRVKHKDA